MTPSTAHLEAARLLGVPTSEIRDVTDSPAGRVIVTSDGVSYLDCIEPDGAGRTGLMYLAAPTEKYSGAFPVYTAPAPAEDGAAAPDNDDATPKVAALAAAIVEAKAPAKKERAALAKKAAGLGITVTRDMDAAALAAAIADAEAAAQ